MVEACRKGWELLYTLESIEYQVINGLWQTWIARKDDGSIKFVIITKLVQYPKGTAIELVLVFGEGLFEDILISQIVEQNSRKLWSRVCNNLNNSGSTEEIEGVRV